MHNNFNQGHVKFVSYSGKFPNLCVGVLSLIIDGKLVFFGHDYTNGNWDKDGHFDSFWCSGGSIDFDDDDKIINDEWTIFKDQLPKEYQNYVYEINDVFNDNVPYGCCGGCL